MLTSNPALPMSVNVAIWSLRSVPVTLLGLMFVFNSGSLRIPYVDLYFWIDAIAVLGIVAIVGYWDRLKGLRWNAGSIVYLYIGLSLILRNPYGVLTSCLQGQMSNINQSSLWHSLWVGLGILTIGLVLEIAIVYIKRLQNWAWWVAFAVSIFYVSTIVFFFSGTLGIWALLDPETKQAFRKGKMHNLQAKY
jgi:hypothetical protein